MQYFSVFILTVSLFCWKTHASEKVQPKAATPKENEQCKQYPSPGMPGIPGIPGAPGSLGRDGFKGEKGTPGKRGLQGAVGTPGKIGPRGPEGPKGEKGKNGTMGIKGSSGFPGNSGATGPRGLKGENGTKGEKGDPANIDPRQLANWKQCVWRATTDTNKVTKIKECFFNKLYDNTALKVSFQGNIQNYNVKACNRWYFKFNGNECSGPMTIDSVLYTDWNGGISNIHRHHSFEGYCENLARGTVRVELWTGKCSGYPLGNAFTGWNSVSRIMIEELPPSQ